MSLFSDFIPPEFKEYSTLAITGMSSFYNPRRYINLVCLEKPAVIFIRYILIALSFSIIQTIVFSTIPNSNNFWLSTLKILLFDALLSMSLIPVFWIPFRLLKHNNPNKVIFGFLYPLRYILLTPVIMFYALFLATEDYIWVVPRGILFYFGVIALIIIPPVYIFNRFSKKLLALFGIILILIAEGLMVTHIINKFKTNESSFSKLSLLYDPISDEIDRKVSPFNDLSSIEVWPTSFEMASEIVFHAGTTDNGQTLTLSKSSMQELHITWLVERSHFYRSITERENTLLKQIEKTKFETSKSLLKQDYNAIAQAKIIGSMLDAYLSMPSGRLIAQMIPEYLKLLKICNKRSEDLLSHQKTRTKLLKYGLIW